MAYFQGELSSSGGVEFYEPWCVHCQQGGEIPPKGFLRGREKLLIVSRGRVWWTKGENSGRDSWGCTHFAFVRMHFRGSLSFSMLLHRCVEPFASVLRSRCFDFPLLLQLALVLCLSLDFGQLEARAAAVSSAFSLPFVLCYSRLSVVRLRPILFACCNSVRCT